MDKKYVKDFDRWNGVKKRLDGEGGVPSFHVREIRWVSVGVNVPSEMCGKGNVFSRPVLVLKKSERMFFGIPLTGSVKHVSGWYKYDDGCLVFNQARGFDSRRVLGRKGKVGSARFVVIQKAFVEYLYGE